MACPSSLRLPRHYSAYSKQCFTMCNTGNWVAVNKGVRRPLVRFLMNKRAQRCPVRGTRSVRQCKGRPEKPVSTSKQVVWMKQNRILICFSEFTQLLIFSFLCLLGVCMCVCQWQSTPQFHSSAGEEVNVTSTWTMAGCWCFSVGLEKVFWLWVGTWNHPQGSPS